MNSPDKLEAQYASLNEVTRITKEIASRPPLNGSEKAVLEHLAKAYNTFCTLDLVHPDEGNEFRAAIHQAQYLIARRVARRVDPEIWA